ALPKNRAAVVGDDVDVSVADFEQRRAGDRFDGGRLRSDPVEHTGQKPRASPISRAAIDTEDTPATEPAVAQRNRPKLARPQVHIRLRGEGILRRSSGIGLVENP